MKKNKNEKMISAVSQWLDDTVIGLNLCPFAKKPREDGAIDIRATDEEKLDDQIRKALEDINGGSFETILLALDADFDFQSFYALCGEVEDGLEKAGLGGHFQIVAFHPEFVFEGLEPDDRANLVNRSPYPLIHFLKVSSISDLGLEPGAGEEISKANEEMLKKMKPEEIKKAFSKPQ